MTVPSRHAWPQPVRPITGATCCDQCGSTRVQYRDWVDSNRDRVIGGDCGGDSSDLWCEWCDDRGHDGHNYQDWVDLADIRPNARKLRKALRDEEAAAYKPHTWVAP